MEIEESKQESVHTHYIPWVFWATLEVLCILVTPVGEDDIYSNSDKSPPVDKISTGTL
jgi:hypothetical protein